MKVDHRTSVIPRWLYVLAAAASIALHLLMIVACGFFSFAPAAAPDVVVTVRLIASPLAIASRASAADTSARLQDEDRALRQRETETTTKQHGKLAHPGTVSTTASDGSPARHSASKPTPQTLSRFPQPDIPAIPSRPVDESDNVARRSREDYSELLAKRLSNVKNYPELAVMRHDEGIVVLYLYLDHGGHVLISKIAASSGRNILDEEVLRMVKAAEPFPPFPASWERPTAEFTIPISFALNLQ